MSPDDRTDFSIRQRRHNQEPKEEGVARATIQSRTRSSSASAVFYSRLYVGNLS